MYILKCYVCVLFNQSFFRMKTCKTKQELRSLLSILREKNCSVGFVPTMGALHKGHLSIIKKAKKKNNIVVVSIFVNPIQFDKKKDLINYPKTLDKDIELLKNVRCDVLFLPSEKEIYNDNPTSLSFDFDNLENKLEGKFRKNHFNGVATIVKKLFEIVEPNKAYFGEKDFQQLIIINKLVKKQNINIKIKKCPNYREKDGLSMSSRNARLTEKQRKAAPFIYKILKKVNKKFNNYKKTKEINKWVKNKFHKNSQLNLEYFAIAKEKSLKTVKIKKQNKKYRAFIAVFANKVRLIDNIQLYNK